jgi:hypothetical protein
MPLRMLVMTISFGSGGRDLQPSIRLRQHVAAKLRS